MQAIVMSPRNAGAYLLRLGNAMAGSVGVGVAVGRPADSADRGCCQYLFISLAVYGASGNFNLRVKPQKGNMSGGGSLDAISVPRAAAPLAGLMVVIRSADLSFVYGGRPLSPSRYRRRGRPG